MSSIGRKEFFIALRDVDSVKLLLEYGVDLHGLRCQRIRNVQLKYHYF